MPRLLRLRHLFEWIVMKSSAVLLLWFYNQWHYNHDKQDSIPLSCQVIMTTLTPVRIRINWITSVKFTEAEARRGRDKYQRVERGLCSGSGLSLSVYSAALILWARPRQARAPDPGLALRLFSLGPQKRHKYDPTWNIIHSEYNTWSKRERRECPLAQNQYVPRCFRTAQMHFKVSPIQTFIVSKRNGFVVAEWLS